MKYIFKIEEIISKEERENLYKTLCNLVKVDKEEEILIAILVLTIGDIQKEYGDNIVIYNSDNITILNSLDSDNTRLKINSKIIDDIYLGDYDNYFIVEDYISLGKEYFKIFSLKLFEK